MSDQMTSAEVEDILSSIRRLVSEENRVGAGEDGKDQKPIDRLVLTPSLRVEAHADAAPSAAQEPVFEPFRQPETDEADDDDVDTSGQSHDAPVETVEEAPFEAADAGEYGQPDLDPPLAFEFRRLGPMRLHDAAAATEETEEAADADPVAATQESASIEPPETERPFTVSVLRQPPNFADETPDVPEPPAGSLGEKIAALETLIARRRDEWEPDEASESDYAGTDGPPLEWQDAELSVEDFEGAAAASETVLEAEEVFEAPEEEAPIEAPDEQQPMEQAPAGDEADLPGESDLAEDEAFLDEDALREIVADVVRQELQGALGERITRNVRKLVRREIHRALAAQDLE